jgi:hypothetical protein
VVVVETWAVKVELVVQGVQGASVVARVMLVAKEAALEVSGAVATAMEVARTWQVGRCNARCIPHHTRLCIHSMSTIRSTTCRRPSNRGNSRGTCSPTEMATEVVDTIATAVAIFAAAASVVAAATTTAETVARAVATLPRSRCTVLGRHPMGEAGRCSTPR